MSEQAKAHKREYRKKYYWEHREECLAKSKEWRENNKEKHSENYRKWAAEHKEERKQYSREWAKNNPEKARAQRQRDYSNHREARKQAVLEYEKNNPEKMRERNNKWREKTGDAMNKVHSAVKRGELTPKPCEACGNPKTEAHHCDYNKPLDVRWLCRKCHTEWHLHNKPKYLD